MDGKIESIKPVNVVFQELYDLLIDNNVSEEVIVKFYELSTTYQKEKIIIKKMHRDIISFMN